MLGRVGEQVLSGACNELVEHTVVLHEVNTVNQMHLVVIGCKRLGIAFYQYHYLVTAVQRQHS